VISNEDLSAFAAIHDMLNKTGQPWRLSCFESIDNPGERYRIELRGPLDMADIEAEAPTLRQLVTTLGLALVAATRGVGQA
jgi:hypothetical protein